jgi:hypothetical protein
MSFFPESIMPSRLKEETQDVKGNKFIVSAADVNKHDEEIRSIQKVIGIRRPRFPSKGFTGGPGGTPGDTFVGTGPGSPSAGCITAAKDVYASLENIFNSLAKLRDDYLLMTSGIVGITDPARSGVDGSILFPSGWPITSLVTSIQDTSVDDEDELEVLDSVQLSDVSELPDEGGFVTIINDASPIMFTSSAYNFRAVGYTSLATSSNPIYSQDDVEVDESASLKQRIFGLGTNVEILEYSELDRLTNLLLNVKRKQLGTTSTRHNQGDLVFGGRLSLYIGPVNYRFASTPDRQRIDALDCVLRSNGKVEFSLRKRDTAPDLSDDRTSLAYVHYHALLFQEVAPIPPFEPGDAGECEEFS